MIFPLRKTFLTLNKYNFNSYNNNDDCTITIQLKDYNNNNVSNENITIYLDDEVLDTITTNTNGIATLTHNFDSRDDIGIHIFRANECIIRCKVFYDTGWNDVSFNTGYTHANTKVQYRVIDNVVHICGEANNTKVINSSNAEFGSIPSQFGPPNHSVYQLTQGSVANKWIFGVNTSGKLWWDRYGTTTNSSTLPYGDYPQWLVINLMYTI